ncbi:MAG: OB-fold nucleic acid binding domain-containing protein [Kineosporiaceae bacterium]|jgi:hypothetical protein
MAGTERARTERTGKPAPRTSTSRLRAALSRLVTPQAQVLAEQEQERAAELGGTLVADLESRHDATVCGTLRSVTLRPRAGVPALEAALYDGSGTLTVVWLGRRQIAGIEPGRRIRVHGMITTSEGEPALFNPRYELVARAGE